jgi:hypothetical protein
MEVEAGYQEGSEGGVRTRLAVAVHQLGRDVHVAVVHQPLGLGAPARTHVMFHILAVVGNSARTPTCPPAGPPPLHARMRPDESLVIISGAAQRSKSAPPLSCGDYNAVP